ncbi:MAG: response regulator [Anaerolineae bacterium]|nr:response regulator [Anaerolineae bacterium]
MYSVVMVDDHREISQLLGIVLRHPALDLHTAEDGFEGLRLIRQVQPDLVMLDVMMPGMSGWEVYDAVRADPALGETPIIILTVVPEQAERRYRFTDSARDLYVTKPFDTLTLRRDIERMLGGISLWR